MPCCRRPPRRSAAGADNAAGGCRCTAPLRRASFSSAHQARRRRPPISDADAGPAQAHARKLRALLRDGQLEQREVEIEVPVSTAPMLGMLNQPGAQEGHGAVHADDAGHDAEAHEETQSMTVAEARRVLLEQEFDKMLDRDDVIADALERIEETGHHLPRRDRQDRRPARWRQAAPMSRAKACSATCCRSSKGSNVQTKYGMVKTDHVLFIAAGAFHVVEAERSDSGAAGPLPDSRRTEAAHRGGFRPHHDGAGECADQAVRRAGGVGGATLTFATDGIAEIARVATVCNTRMENIGARRLHTVMTTLLEELLYGLPDRGDAAIVVERGDGARAARGRCRGRGSAALHPLRHGLLR